MAPRENKPTFDNKPATNATSFDQSLEECENIAGPSQSRNTAARCGQSNSSSSSTPSTCSTCNSSSFSEDRDDITNDETYVPRDDNGSNSDKEDHKPQCFINNRTLWSSIRRRPLSIKGRRQSSSCRGKSNMTAQLWKEKGDHEFNECNWSDALNHYTNALHLVQDDPDEKAVYHKKRAFVYFMMTEYKNAITECDMALRFTCSYDLEALFLRCQALEALERFEEAHRDAEIILSADPNTKNNLLLAARLREIVQKRRNENTSISSKISQLMDLAFDVNANKEKRESAMNNLLVLARERAGAEEILEKDGESKIVQLVKVEQNEELVCSAIRIVGELCKCTINRIEFFVEYDGLSWCLAMMNSTSTERINASLYCLQSILNVYSGMNNKRYSIHSIEYELSIPKEASCRVHETNINKILSCVLDSIRSRTIPGIARDALIEFIMGNINYTALNWAKRLVEFGGLQGLLEVASEMEEYKHESSIDITSSTRVVISKCLAKIYESTCSNDKKSFSNAINKFIENKFLLSDRKSKMRTVLAITTLILGSLDIVDVIISKNGIIKMILAMSQTDDVLQQRVACECIIAAATKFKQIDVFLWQGIDILQNLYDSYNDDSIRVRAFVGLCKLCRFEWSIHKHICTIDDPFENEAAKELAKVCRRFLTNSKKEKDMKKWAIKGLSYLTFDAEVKEELIEEKEAIHAMFELAKTGDQSILYAVITTLANLCNAYDDEECSSYPKYRIKKLKKLIPKIPEIPERKEQSFFCKYFEVQHWVPNQVDFVNKRRRALAEAGVTGALVSLAKADNQNYKELIARVFNGICSQEEVREIIVEQGGTKALLPLALDGTEKGKKYALQALVYLALPKHHEVAFLGQMVMEIVCPKLMETNIKILLKLLTMDDTVQNKKIKKLASLALEVAAEWDENQRDVEGNKGTSQSTDNIE